MSARPYHNECLPQFLLPVGLQYPFQFGMNGLDSGRQHAKIEDTGAEPIHEYKPPEISVSRHKYPAQFLCQLDQFGVRCPREPQSSHADNVMPESLQEPSGCSVNVLV